jgi:hypothetical protein
MFKALLAMREDDVPDWLSGRCEDVYDKKSKLPDNCSPDQFSSRINKFTVHINPYLEPALSGERLGKSILGQLPQCLASDVRGLKDRGARGQGRARQRVDRDRKMPQALLRGVRLLQLLEQDGRLGVGRSDLDRLRPRRILSSSMRSSASYFLFLLS